ncbi:DUF2235 domain-containing protein [Pseudanabaena sp. 'Roaring Creek']|uniref:DUF2235 domain-containing protein n=1 Tax=Pseudanabaena sp. 'Roaring Creek' TaxID=1681830 RepID=UPI0006D83545|nr:DUF2235 domain-containing protein [Pseudanabaena sp. 'Roaring Creek']
MKRLIVCCDGTWIKLEKPDATNVLKIAQSVQAEDDLEIQQIVFYDQGIGTDGDFIDQISGGAFGWGIDQKIQSAYRFLSLNYQEGDEIYLFGFSRGAYTVRCVAGFIYCAGLLKRQYIHKTPEAYQLYRDRNSSTHPSGEKAIKFRETYGEHVSIRALCCWDTVGSLGIPDLIPNFPLDNWVNKQYEFFDVKINRLIQNAFHAVAIDELRKSFLVTPMELSDGSETQIHQLWFVGDHGSIGGGVKEKYGLSDITLEWMMEWVEKLGLAIDRSCVESPINPQFDIPFDNEPKGIFKLAGEVRREIEGDISSLHETVKQRWQHDPSYRPENLLRLQQELDM